MIKPEDIAWMIDPTSFETVVAYGDNDPKITWAIIAHEGLELAELGVIIKNDDASRLKQLVEEGKAQFVARTQAPPDRPPVLLYSEIPMNEMVYIIYLPPFYLLKRTGKEWK